MDASVDQPVNLSESQFDASVLSEIKNYQASHSGSFVSHDKLGYSDCPLLLMIILSTGQPLGFKPMSLKSCGEHLFEQRDLIPALAVAYTNKSFWSLISHDSMHSLTKEVDDVDMDSGGPLVRSDSDTSLKAAFEENYIGNLPELFVETLTDYSQSTRGVEASKRAYSRSISIIQSSGMGKSRLVEQVGNLVFTIPINLREELHDGAQTYPPPDIELRGYFALYTIKEDKLLQVEYAIFLTSLFKCVASKVPDIVTEPMQPGLLAKEWARYLGEGQNVSGVGRNREKLYREVVRRAKKKLAKIPTVTSPTGITKLDDPSILPSLISKLRNSLGKLIEIIAPAHLPAHGGNLCYVYFDEAHGLTKAPSNVDPSCRMSPYHNLGKILSEVSDQDAFFIFLSTNSHLRQFAPPSIHHPSIRASQGYRVFPSFTELPFDVFIPAVLKELREPGQVLSLDSLCTTKVMSGFGRPMWFVHHKQWQEQQIQGDNYLTRRSPIHGPRLHDIITFAMDKLTACGAVRRSQSGLAAISVRLGVSFDPTTELSRWMEAKQVESHMRVVYAIPEHGEYMRTGSPSEPILAEAAARFLNERYTGGIARSGPKVLAEYYQKGFLAWDERGELCGRLLVTVAHDIAIQQTPLRVSVPSSTPRPEFHRPVPVLNFLRALFAQEYHNTVLEATTVNSSRKRPGQFPTLEQAFGNAYISFSHFELAQDSEVLEASQLRYCLIRGCAIQARDNQVSIDAVIPIHMGSVNDPITTETMSAINLQFKNRKQAAPCSVNRSITIPNVEQPVISIVFELGEEYPPSPLVHTHHEKPRRTGNATIPHRDDHHYTLVAHGCGPSTFGVVSEKSKPRYDLILGGGTLLQDFPRQNREGLVTYLENMRPLRQARAMAHLSAADEDDQEQFTGPKIWGGYEDKVEIDGYNY